MNFVIPIYRQKLAVSGVIYDASWGQYSGEVVIVTGQGITLTIPYERFLEARDAFLSSEIGVGVIRGVGAGLLTLGVSGIALTAKPLITSELAYQFHKASNIVQEQFVNKEYKKARQEASQDAQDKEYAQKFAQEVGVPNSDFYVYIPKIDAKAPVIPNVDSSQQVVYIDALKKGVAHAYGSSVPGQPGGTYIFAHSTNGPWNVSAYNAVFYLLRELDPKTQDEIYVFYQGKVHKYIVSEKHIVDGSDLSWLLGSRSGDERLILQTCWPPGTVWKRLIVVATPEKVNTSANVIYGGS